MTVRHQVQYALQELFPRGLSPRGSFYALALVVGLFVPIYSVTLIGCLRSSMAHWQTARLMADKTSRCITLERVGDKEDALRKARLTAKQDISEATNLRFDEGDLSYLRTRLAEDGWMDKQPKEVHGYLYLLANLGNLSTMTRSTKGEQRLRSIDPGDPSFESLRFVWRKCPTVFEGEGVGQVALSRPLYELLLATKTLPPPAGTPVKVGIEYIPCLQGLGNQLNVRLGNDGIEALEVVGIYEETSPAVVTTHRFLADLADYTWYPTDYYHSIHWGPVPAGVDPILLAAKIQPQLPSLGLVVSPQRLEGRDYLHLRRAEGNGPLTRENWLENIANRFQKQLPAYFPSAVPAQYEHQFPSRTTTERSRPKDTLYRRVDITVDDLDQVVALAAAVDRMGLARPFSDDRVRNARSVSQQNEAWRWIQWMVLALTATMALLSLSLALRQRIQQKTSEVGIMMAYGARAGLITAIFNWQAVLVWLLASGLAALLTPPTFHLVKGKFLSMNDTIDSSKLESLATPGGQDLFAQYHSLQADSFAWVILLWVIVGSLVAAMLCNVASCLAVSKIQPASALKVQ